MILHHYNQHQAPDGEISDQQARDLEIRADMGLPYDALVRTAPWRRKLLTALYHPVTEITIFILILISIGLLVAEISMAEDSSGGWMGVLMGRAEGLFFWADVLITICFVAEYVLKLIVAPNKAYFFRANLVDLLALLPIMRIFRLGRAVRLFRLLRMLRVMRVGTVLEQRLDRVNAERQKFRVENTVIAVYMFFSLVFGSVGIMVFEKGTNPDFAHLSDGLWWCVVTITTVGYGDISPQTVGGKVVATIIMFIGLSFYALLTSTISSILIERARHNEGSEITVATLDHHVVICGWNDSALGLLQDFLSRPYAPPVVLLTNQESAPRLHHPNLHYVFADPTTANGLSRARARYADVVVVLPIDTTADRAQDADARTILTVLAVERLRPQVHTIAQILNPANTFHAQNAGVDEILHASSCNGVMLSQAVQSPGITDFYQTLFLPGGPTIQRIALPSHLQGKPFLAAATALMHDGMMVMGIQRGDALMMPPEPEQSLDQTDTLIVMAAAPGPMER